MGRAPLPGSLPLKRDSSPEMAPGQAGLVHVTDTDPGITRRRHGRGFSFFDPQGEPIRDRAPRRRLRALPVPPAWTGVWISPDPRGHVQATGRDRRGRKQYLYHPRWRQVRDADKYARMVDFAGALPRIRRRVRRDLRLPGLPREKVLATVLRLLELTLIRVGNDEYVRENRSYGLTTMRDRHVGVDGSGIRFVFRGKSGVDHEVPLHDRRLAGIVRRCEELPGQRLFQWLDESGERHAIHSDDVNQYLREAANDDFTAKDFRTWAGTVLAARALQEFEKVDSEAAAKHNVIRAIEQVARRLGNTRAICRRSYVHPAVIDFYLEGSLAELLSRRADELMRTTRLPAAEAAVLGLLQQRLRREAGN